MHRLSPILQVLQDKSHLKCWYNLCPSVPSDVPLNLLVVPVNATSVRLSWDPPLPEHQNGPIEAYHIAITETDTDAQLQHISTENSTIIGPLHPFYTYKFSVAAVTVQVGPFTSQVTLQLPEAGTCSFTYITVKLKWLLHISLLQLQLEL